MEFPAAIAAANANKRKDLAIEKATLPKQRKTRETAKSY